jgi:enamine deaminase RidA (YjgF/YER057c/UK114 family)
MLPFEKEESMSSFHRRGFLGGALALILGRSRASKGAIQSEKTAEDRLAELGIELPPVPTPVATYVPSVRSGSMLYVSGSGPGNGPDGQPVRGKVGRDLTLEQANAAARLAGLRILANVRHSLGSLNKVERVVKVLGMVNATPDFGQQPQVVNGFSDLMVEIFGEERGKGARSAVGMGSLPSGIPVEVEAIFEVSD